MTKRWGKFTVKEGLPSWGIKYLHSDEAVPREQYDRVVGLLEKLIGRVNRVTSRHLHKGVEVTEQDLNRLVDCQHEVEEVLKDEKNNNDR